LRYRCYWLLLDLDELAGLPRQLRLFSHNRWNLFSLFDRDHGDCSGRPLKAYVEALLAAAGLPVNGGAIRLLTMPRMLGYAFNPISIYFCHARNGALTAVLYEVRNTFGQRHSYLIPAEAGSSGPIIQHCRKAFYVSPFMDMDLDYEFRVAAPADSITVTIRAGNATGPVLTAALAARPSSLTDRALAALLFTHPLLTLKVIAAIHYEAAWLLLKGIGLRTRPAPPALAVSQPSRRPLESTRNV